MLDTKFCLSSVLTYSISHLLKKTLGYHHNKNIGVDLLKANRLLIFVREVALCKAIFQFPALSECGATLLC